MLILVVYVAPERAKVSANSRRNARYFLIESPLNSIGSLSYKRVVAGALPTLTIVLLLVIYVPGGRRGESKSVDSILKTSLVPIEVVSRRSRLGSTGVALVLYKISNSRISCSSA